MAGVATNGMMVAGMKVSCQFAHRYSLSLRYYSGSVHLIAGEWKNGDFHGKGIYSWADDDKYVGEWVGGKRNGKVLFIIDSCNLDAREHSIAGMEICTRVSSKMSCDMEKVHSGIEMAINMMVLFQLAFPLIDSYKNSFFV